MREELNKMGSEFCKFREEKEAERRLKWNTSNIMRDIVVDEDCGLSILFYLTHFSATKVLLVVRRKQCFSEHNSSVLLIFPSGICPHVHSLHTLNWCPCKPVWLFSVKSIQFCWTIITFNEKVLFHWVRKRLINLTFTAVCFHHTLLALEGPPRRQLFQKAGWCCYCTSLFKLSSYIMSPTSVLWTTLFFFAVRCFYLLDNKSCNSS